MSTATVLAVFAFLISSAQQAQAQQGLVSITNLNTSVNEGDGEIFYNVTREGGSGSSAAFLFTVVHVTTDPEDFLTNIPGFVVFGVGETEITISKVFNDDTIVEETEEFIAILISLEEFIPPFQVTSNIVDNDFSATQWSEWADNGTCSTSCGSGSKTQSRTRNCTGNCPDSYTLIETRTTTCMACNCPVISEWTEWADDGSCSTSCGRGIKMQARTRNCTNSTCCLTNVESNETRTVDCEVFTCPVIGTWSSWAESGQCSVTCGGGTRMQARTRECSNPCMPCDCVKYEERTLKCNCFPCSSTWNGWSGSGRPDGKRRHRGWRRSRRPRRLAQIRFG